MLQCGSEGASFVGLIRSPERKGFGWRIPAEIQNRIPVSVNPGDESKELGRREMGTAGRDWTNIYMHDGGLRGIPKFLGNGYKAAAVYSVPNDAKPQRLSRISTVHRISENPTPMLLQIYRNPQDPKNPESGEALLKEKQRTNPNANYMLYEKLAEEVILYPGDRFSIVLEVPASEDSGLLMLYQDMDDEDYISGIENIDHTEPGESFTYTKNQQ